MLHQTVRSQSFCVLPCPGRVAISSFNETLQGTKEGKRRRFHQ
jgi:hypothetical protein